MFQESKNVFHTRLLTRICRIFGLIYNSFFYSCKRLHKKEWGFLDVLDYVKFMFEFRDFNLTTASRKVEKTMKRFRLIIIYIYNFQLLCTEYLNLINNWRMKYLSTCVIADISCKCDK